MSACLLSAYVSSFFMGYYGTDAGVAAAEIAPVCEEIMKLIPLVLYFLIFEPNTEELPAAAIAIAVGFATFENACYLTENGAENLSFMLIRGVSAGALHIAVRHCGGIWHCAGISPPLAGCDRNGGHSRRVHRDARDLQSPDFRGGRMAGGGLSDPVDRNRVPVHREAGFEKENQIMKGTQCRARLYIMISACLFRISSFPERIYILHLGHACFSNARKTGLQGRYI